MGDGYDVIVGGIDQQQLKDFSLERRDRVAIRQIRERGALVNIQTGAGEPPSGGMDNHEAISITTARWVSQAQPILRKAPRRFAVEHGISLYRTLSAIAGGFGAIRG